MTRHELRDLRWTLRSVVGEVAATGAAVVIADDNTDVAVIVSMSDYERLRANRPLLSRISAGPGGGGFGWRNLPTVGTILRKIFSRRR